MGYRSATPGSVYETLKKKETQKQAKMKMKRKSSMAML